MSGNRSGMDPDRYQMRSLKRRVTALEKAQVSDRKHLDRMGVRLHTQKESLEDALLNLENKVKVLMEITQSMHSRFPKDLWEQS